MPATDIVIFGLGRQSSLAWYVYAHDSPHRVVAFTVDAAYRTETTLHGLPVVAFEALEAEYPPHGCVLCVPLGWRGMNRLRAERVAQARQRGFAFASYVSSRAQVWPDLQIGANCMIHDGAIVQPFARIGTNVIVRAGAVISHHATIGDHCFIAARAVVAGSATLGERCVLGLNCTICDGVTVAPGCFIGAGAVVSTDTAPGGVYTGRPARRRALPADSLGRVRRDPAARGR